MAFKIPSGADKIQFSIRVDENDFNIIEKLSKKRRKFIFICARLY